MQEKVTPWVFGVEVGSANRIAGYRWLRMPPGGRLAPVHVSGGRSHLHSADAAALVPREPAVLADGET